jgi:hypothetical protein
MTACLIYIQHISNYTHQCFQVDIDIKFKQLSVLSNTPKVLSTFMSIHALILKCNYHFTRLLNCFLMVVLLHLHVKMMSVHLHVIHPPYVF